MNAKHSVRFVMTILAWLALGSCAVSQSFDTESELGNKMNTIRTAEALTQSHWERLSLLEKSIAYLKRAVPLYSWLSLCNVVDGSDWQFFLGECLDAQTRHMLRLPPTNFRSEYLDALNELWSSNPLDALTFSSAMRGYSSSDTALANIAPIVHVGLMGWMTFAGVRRLRQGRTFQARLKSIGLTKAFSVCAVLWIALTVVLRIGSAIAPINRTLLNLQTLVLLLFGLPAIILGLLLLVRFARQVISRFASGLQKQRSSADFPIKRWHALVKYDEEVAAAAATLQQFGEEWIDKLGEEFFALNEDRRYLQRIASRLAQEAQRSQLASP